jgi:hypothetical protein
VVQNFTLCSEAKPDFSYKILILNNLISWHSLGLVKQAKPNKQKPKNNEVDFHITRSPWCSLELRHRSHCRSGDCHHLGLVPALTWNFVGSIFMGAVHDFGALIISMRNKGKSITGIAILIFVIIMGCSGTYGKLKTQSQSDSKFTQQELIGNWSDYDIWFKSTVIVFDPKSDDKKILVGNDWDKVKDHETWTKIVKANTTSHDNIHPVLADYSMTGVREIWGPDNHLYGYIINQRPDLVSTKVVDENTMRLYYHRARFGGGP